MKSYINAKSLLNSRGFGEGLQSPAGHSSGIRQLKEERQEMSVLFQFHQQGALQHVFVSGPLQCFRDGLLHILQLLVLSVYSAAIDVPAFGTAHPGKEHLPRRDFLQADIPAGHFRTISQRRHHFYGNFLERLPVCVAQICVYLHDAELLRGTGTKAGDSQRLHSLRQGDQAVGDPRAFEAAPKRLPDPVHQLPL